MTAAERERPEDPVPISGPGSELDDSAEALSATYPLHDALLLSQQALSAPYRLSSEAATQIESRSRMLRLWACWAGAAALALIAFEISFTAVSSFADASSRLPGAIRTGAVLAAVVALGSLAWGAMTSASGKALLERHRAERCLLLKFRFLIDPNLWTRRGNEAGERRQTFRSDAEALPSLTAGRLREWSARDTVTIARTLPVGSGIDPHTVHTLVDYYQERRLNPRLQELAAAIGESPARDRPRQLVPALFFAGVVLAGVHAALSLPWIFPHPPRGAWSAAAAALAAALPAIGLALHVSRPGSGFSADRSRHSGMHHALTELSGRLQKASGAEAIFQELGFCEDVFETHHREWLRAMLSDA